MSERVNIEHSGWVDIKDGHHVSTPKDETEISWGEKRALLSCAGDIMWRELSSAVIRQCWHGFIFPPTQLSCQIRMIYIFKLWSHFYCLYFTLKPAFLKSQSGFRTHHSTTIWLLWISSGLHVVVHTGLCSLLLLHTGDHSILINRWQESWVSLASLLESTLSPSAPNLLGCPPRRHTCASTFL